MKKQGDLLLAEERKLITELGFLIGIEVELWKLPPPQPSEFPQGYKLRLIAYNLENPSKLVRIDNHCGKSPHYHSNGKQKFFTWVSLKETERLFLQLAQEKFGDFEWNMNIKSYEK